MIMTIYLKYCKDVVDCGLVYKCVCMINRATEALDVHRTAGPLHSHRGHHDDTDCEMLVQE